MLAALMNLGFAGGNGTQTFIQGNTGRRRGGVRFIVPLTVIIALVLWPH